MVTHMNNMASTLQDKFQQPGWRIEQKYRPGVLIGECMQAQIYSQFDDRLLKVMMASRCVSMLREDNLQ